MSDMFSWRKDSADISGEEPTFHVRYVGATETFIPNGKGCTTQPLQKLWDNAPTERHLKRVAVQLSLKGIYMKDLDHKNPAEAVTIFPMEDISYCSADQNVNDRLFCWISKNPVSRKLEARAVLCSTRDKAQTMAAVLSRAFHLAYKDWRAERQRDERRKVASPGKVSGAETGSLTGSIDSRTGSLGSPKSQTSSSISSSRNGKLIKTNAHIENVN